MGRTGTRKPRPRRRPVPGFLSTNIDVCGVVLSQSPPIICLLHPGHHIDKTIKHSSVATTEDGQVVLIVQTETDEIEWHALQE